MTAKSPSSRPAFITPLSGLGLLDPGEIFPREELLRRVLSLFWRDCCSVPRFSRAPAPVVQLSGGGDGAGPQPRLRAWWLLCDGIIDEVEGPYSERVQLFFGDGDRKSQLWPRYEFRVIEHPCEVEMSFHQDPGAGWGSRLRFQTCLDGRLQVAGREPWWS